MANIKSIYGNPVADDALRQSVATEYSSSSTYAVGDIVLKDGQLYECNTAISTAEAWTAAHWTAVTVGEKLTDLETASSELKEDYTTILDSAYAIDTASGAIASFPDGADNVPVKSLTVDIEPVQSGSGYPSPTNVRPISGHTSAAVTRCGKNLFDKNAVSTNKWLSTSTGLEEPSAGYYITDYIPVEANKSYFIPATSTARRWFYDANKTPKRYLENALDQVFTPTENGYIRITILVDGDGAKDINTYQVEQGSSASAYEPYTGQTYTIDLDGTVYGGTLDVTTGVLTVAYGYKTYGSSLTWSISDAWGHANTAVFYASAPDTSVNYKNDTYNPMLCCNILPVMSRNDLYNSDANGFGYSGQPYSGIPTVRISKSIASDASAFNTWIANNPITVVCELVTPQTIQLTAQEVRTLLGQNNVFADCGDTTVEYRADTKLYIQKVISG